MKQFLTNLLIITYYLFCMTTFICLLSFVFFIDRLPIQFGISLFLSMIIIASFEQINTYIENLKQ